MRNGEYADVTPGSLQALRLKHGLSQVELAALAGSSVFKHKRGPLQARRVQAWEAGDSRIPLPTWELLQLRLFMLGRGLSTFEELTTRPLVDIVQSNLRNQ